MTTKHCLIVFIPFLAGCVSEVTGPRQSIWEAELVGTAEQPRVSGSAAAVSQARSTMAGITVSNLEPGMYGWRVREGDCGTTGPVQGGESAYPTLVVEDEASVSAEAVLPRAMRSGAAYAAEVRSEATDKVVACGAFTERE